MLKKENRLTTNEFDLVFKSGKKKFSKNFMFIKLENKKSLKISTTISKKIYKTAVQRNQSRRKIYEILGQNFEKIPKDFWATLIMTKPILEIDNEILKKEILWLFKEKKTSEEK